MVVFATEQHIVELAGLEEIQAWVVGHSNPGLAIHEFRIQFTLLRFGEPLRNNDFS